MHDDAVVNWPQQAALAVEIRHRFGLDPRPPQLALISRALVGQSSLGVMPTGAGKSLTYQAAAALLPGTVLVVSPLLALMRDQVERLVAGPSPVLRAARLDSTLDRTESSAVLGRLAAGELDLLYVAPERLANERFQAALSRARVALLAIDEAHCISAWGHDFRPDYLRLPLLRADLGGPPVLALTATATVRVQADVCRDFGIPPEGVVNTGARRPNLALRVEVPAERPARLRQLVRADPTAPTIVYALRQADTERLARLLQADGVAAAAYHAGLADERRAEVQDRFLADDLSCVVATIAFGMGVDKPNVRRVIHAHAPRSLEGYWQEIGRAGRDGAPAEVTLLYAEGDLTALANFVDGRAPDPDQVRGALNQAFTSREGPDVIAFPPGAVGDAHDLDPQALRTLLARLELRGVVRALTPAYDAYQLPVSLDRAAVARSLGPPDDAAWRSLLAAGKVGRIWLTLGLAEAARAADLPLDTARRIFRRAEDEGLIAPRLAGVLHRYQVLRRPDRATDLPALLEAVRDAIAGEHARLAAVRAYILEPRCRVSHGLAYLGDQDTTPCGCCDLCSGGRPVDPASLLTADWQLGFDPTEVQALARLNPAGPDPIGVARALCQISSPRSRLYRKHPAWGRFDRAPYRQVLRAVEGVL
jgi:ATP-dependent DNA helicase RecQ